MANISCGKNLAKVLRSWNTSLVFRLMPDGYAIKSCGTKPSNSATAPIRKDLRKFPACASANSLVAGECAPCFKPSSTRRATGFSKGTRPGASASSASRGPLSTGSRIGHAASAVRTPTSKASSTAISSLRTSFSRRRAVGPMTRHPFAPRLPISAWRRSRKIGLALRRNC